MQTLAFSTALLLLTVVCAPGQDDFPLEPADTSSPRATLRSFLEACDEIYAIMQKEEHEGAERDAATHDRIADRILDCFDLSQEAEFLRRERGERTAVCLKEIFDRIDLPPDNEIPGPEEIAASSENGGLKEWRLPHTAIRIARVEEGLQQGEYLFDPATVALAPRYYKAVKDVPYKPGASRKFYQWFLSDPGPWLAPVVHKLPDWARTTFWGNHAVWQWAGFLISLVAAAFLIVIFFSFGRRTGHKIRTTSVFRYCLTLVFPILATLTPLVFSDFVREQIRFSGLVLSMTTFTANLIFLFGVLLVIVGAGSRIAEIMISHPKIEAKGLDAQLIRIICRVLSLLTALIVFLEGGKYLGIPLTTLLASAGVGGVAIALAAQDSLKNFFGTMMIILDKPYRLGERIVAKGYDGIVEEIGLRSTKLRLLTGHQATIPNEEMARCDIENIGRRPHIRRVAELRLPIDTPPAKIQEAVELVREILDNHEGMQPEFPPRVYFTEMKPGILNLQFFYWYHPPNYWDFLEFSQLVNLRITRTFREHGISLETPLKTLNLKKSAEDTQSPDAQGNDAGGQEAPSA